MWICNGRKAAGCSTPSLSDDVLRGASVIAINQLISEKDTVLENLSILLDTLLSASELETQLEKLQERLDTIKADMSDVIRRSANASARDEECHQQFEALYAQQQRIEAEMQKVCDEIDHRASRRIILGKYLEDLKAQPLLDDFDERVFTNLVEYGTVHSNCRIVFTFKDGHEVTVEV